MSKKSQYYDKAKELYTIMQLTYSEIAKQIPVTERTLINWGNTDGWAYERERFGDFKTERKEGLKNIIIKLETLIAESLQAKKKVSPQTLNNYAKLTSLYFKFSDVEKKESAEHKDKEPTGSVGENTVKAFESLFGKKL